MPTDVKVEFNSINEVLINHGLQKDGPVQTFFTNEVFRSSDKYTPFRNSMLKTNVDVNPSDIIYNSPYARYMWVGKLMVDPLYKKGAFYNPEFGFWSRPGVQKELTDIDLKYQGAPLRGSHWTERAWIDNKNEIIRNTQNFVNKGGK